MSGSACSRLGSQLLVHTRGSKLSSDLSCYLSIGQPMSIPVKHSPFAKETQIESGEPDSIGSSTRKIVPEPAFELTEISPPWRRTIW